MSTVVVPCVVSCPAPPSVLAPVTLKAPLSVSAPVPPNEPPASVTAPVTVEFALTSTFPAVIVRPPGATSVPTDGRLPDMVVGPFRVMVPPLLLIVPAMALLPAALSVTWSLFAPEAEMVTPPLMVMLLCAVKVNVASAIGVVMIELATVMSPDSPLAPLVVTVTFTPASRAATIVATAMREGVPVGSKLKLALASVSAIRLPVALLMVILVGSSSHWPPLPLGAPASAARVTSSMRLPEVSMSPPSPPSAPPRAAIRP